mmetsp:Transcript_81/g.211  ORF Transcript_81/g.211 Transcript_81/m.211 type:complete len:241 (-) Transcript_81:337-1059(-)
MVNRRSWRSHHIPPLIATRWSIITVNRNFIPEKVRYPSPHGSQYCLRCTQIPRPSVRVLNTTCDFTKRGRQNLIPSTTIKDVASLQRLYYCLFTRRHDRRRGIPGGNVRSWILHSIDIPIEWERTACERRSQCPRAHLCNSVHYGSLRAQITGGEGDTNSTPDGFSVHGDPHERLAVGQPSLDKLSRSIERVDEYCKIRNLNFRGFSNVIVEQISAQRFEFRFVVIVRKHLVVVLLPYDS